MDCNHKIELRIKIIQQTISHLEGLKRGGKWLRQVDELALILARMNYIQLKERLISDL